MTSRRTHCPAGRLLYRDDDLPATLATKTMLRRMRRHPTDGQQPVASMLYAGNEYAPLYEIGASSHMPPLSPGRHEAWLRRHTCARCDSIADARFGPYLLDQRDKRRLCGTCLEREAEARWRARQLAVRADVVGWARGVLAEPDAVVLARQQRNDWRLPFRLRAATIGGAVLLDAIVVPPHPYPDVKIPPEAVPIESLLDHLSDISLRRRIAWNHQHEWAVLGRLITGERATPWPALYIERDDLIGPRYSDWLGHTTDQWIYRNAHCYGVRQKLLPGNPREHVDTMLGFLRLMARDKHPAGRPRCPALPPTGHRPCGATQLAEDGLCAAHQLPSQRNGQR